MSLKNTPKKPDSIEFSYYKAWIHRQTFIPVKVEYYDKSGKKYRIAQALKVDTIQGISNSYESSNGRLKERRKNHDRLFEGAIQSRSYPMISSPNDISEILRGSIYGKRDEGHGRIETG